MIEKPGPLTPTLPQGERGREAGFGPLTPTLFLKGEGDTNPFNE